MPPAAHQSTEGVDQSARLLAAVRELGTREVAAAGDTVLGQGDPGAALYVVESGALDVVVEADEGLRLPVVRLGPRAHFGEMSLLTGTPVSADVVACEPTVLWRVSASQFEALTRADPALMEHLAGQLAARLRHTNVQLAAQQQQQQALGRLLTSQRDCPYKPDLPSAGRRGLDPAAAEDDGPVLIVGEEGVGKRALAQRLHSLSPRATRALLVVDCAALAGPDARRQLFGDADPRHVTRFGDYLGFLQAADGGVLVLAHVDRLPFEVQDDLARFLDSGPGPSRVDVRLIATTTRPPETLQQDEAVSPALLSRLQAGQLLKLAPLRRRRRDIVPLAEHFLECLARRRGRPPKALSEGARRELQGYDYAYSNGSELRQVIELAANLAPGETIGAEHVFFGRGSADTPQVDLLRWPTVARAAKGGRVLRALKALVALVFAGLTAACFLAPSEPLGRFANMLVWGVWWPGLIVSLILLGRAWCAVCPLSSAGEAAQRAAGRRLAPSDRLVRWGPVFALLGFVAIVWVEEAVDMVGHPVRTGWFLVTLVVLAAVATWLFQRHTWCRYLCPLGAMGGVFSAGSALRVRARQEVCAASCTGHECYKGTEHSEGCPMFNHALYLTSGQNCKLCMRCLQDCPHDSPRLVLQPPLQEVWRSDLLSPDVVPLALVIMMLVLLVAATHGGSLSSPGVGAWFAGACVAIALLGLGLVALLAHERGAEGGRSVSWSARVAYAFAPAAGAVLLAYRLRSLLGLEGLSLNLGNSTGWMVGISLLHLLQAASIAVGGGMTLWTLWRVVRLRHPAALGKAVVAWAVLAGAAVVCLLSAFTWMA